LRDYQDNALTFIAVTAIENNQEYKNREIASKVENFLRLAKMLNRYCK